MNIRPTNDLLIVKRIPDEDPETDWGFLLPPGEDFVDTPLRGTVLFAGDGRRPKLSGAGKDVISSLQTLVDALNARPSEDWISCGVSMEHMANAEAALQRQSESPDVIPMTVQVGNTIIFSRHGHQVFRVGGEDVLVMQEASVLGLTATEPAS